MTPEDFLIELVSTSTEETFEIGRRIAVSLVSGLASGLASGSVIAMQGGLGSGKTSLAKGIASGLGIEETITSPTYTIISEYRGKFTLFHIDAYRLNNDEDFDSIGGRELINNGEGIALVEWSERIQSSLPDNAISITLTITGPASRLIKIEGLEI